MTNFHLKLRRMINVRYMSITYFPPREVKWKRFLLKAIAKFVLIYFGIINTHRNDIYSGTDINCLSKGQRYQTIQRTSIYNEGPSSYQKHL